jgi:hypothetical protein
LNLSNAVAVAAFEAWRQHNFIGSTVSRAEVSEMERIRKARTNK